MRHVPVKNGLRGSGIPQRGCPQQHSFVGRFHFFFVWGHLPQRVVRPKSCLPDFFLPGNDWCLPQRVVPFPYHPESHAIARVAFHRPEATARLRADQMQVGQALLFFWWLGSSPWLASGLSFSKRLVAGLRDLAESDPHPATLKPPLLGHRPAVPRQPVRQGVVHLRKKKRNKLFFGSKLWIW